MSLRTRLVVPVIFSALVVLAGCGNSPVKATPPPSGGFSNSHLNGVYVFSVAGSDATGYFTTTAGTFSADGAGNINGGVVDLNDTDPTIGPVLSQTITSGTYRVGVDGRPASEAGILTFQTDAGGTFGFDIVLSASDHGLITEFDQFGSGSGTFNLQGNVPQASINGQSYAFNFSGTSGVDTVLCGTVGGPFVIPFATVGAFTLDSNGDVATGVQDFNENCNSSGQTNMAVTSGSVSLATVPGIATLTTDAWGTLNFDVFPVDATHLKFISADILPAVVGDAFTQASFPTGNNVFNAAGFDTINAEPFTTAGIFDSDGSGSVLSDSVQDINEFSFANAVSGITGTYTAPSGGRSVLTLTGFINGDNGAGCNPCDFAAYPSSGGMQLLEIDNGGVTDGVAYHQVGNPTLASDGYGLNLTGITLNSAEDDIAEFTNSNGNFTGIIDFNDQGSTAFGVRFTSTYTADSTVPGRGTVTPGSNSYFLTAYSIDNSTAVAISTDANFVGVGSMVQQNANAKSNVVASHLNVLKGRAIAKSAVKRHKMAKPR